MGPLLGPLRRRPAGGQVRGHTTMGYTRLIIIIILYTRASSRLLWLPPQISRGRVRQAVSQAADWLHHAARGVVLAGAVGTGSTVDIHVSVGEARSRSSLLAYFLKIDDSLTVIRLNLLSLLLDLQIVGLRNTAVYY